MITTLESGLAFRNGSHAFLTYIQQNKECIDALITSPKNQAFFINNLSRICSQNEVNQFELVKNIINLFLFVFSREEISEIDRTVIELQYGFDFVAQIQSCSTLDESIKLTERVLVWPYQEEGVVERIGASRYLTPGFSTSKHDHEGDILECLYGNRLCTLSLTKSSAHGSAGFGSSLRNLLHDLDHWNENEAAFHLLLRGYEEDYHECWFNLAYEYLSSSIELNPALAPALYICFRDASFLYFNGYQNTPECIELLALYAMVQLTYNVEQDTGDLSTQPNRILMGTREAWSSPVDGTIYFLDGDKRRFNQDDIKQFFGPNAREVFGDKEKKVTFGVYDRVDKKLLYQTNFGRRRRLYEWYEALKAYDTVSHSATLAAPGKNSFQTDIELSNYVKQLKQRVLSYLTGIVLPLIYKKYEQKLTEGNAELEEVDLEDANLIMHQALVLMRAHCNPHGFFNRGRAAHQVRSDVGEECDEKNKSESPSSGPS